MLIIVGWFGFGVFVSDEECVDCVSSLCIEWWKCCWGWFKSEGWWPTRWFEYDGWSGGGGSCCCWKCVVGGGWRWWCPWWWGETNGANCDDDNRS